MWYPTTAFLFQITFLSTLLLRVTADTKCFAPDGVTVADNDTYVPCNKLGITQQGVHSSCCKLDGDPNDRDLCASTGLCVNSGIISRGYCTDKTWKSPACVNVCTDPRWGGSMTGAAEMTSCTDGTYCCGHNNLTCCGTQWAVKVPLLTSTTITTTTITPTPTPAPANQNIAAIAGLGGALGLVTLVSAGVVFYLVRQIRLLKSGKDDSHKTFVPEATSPQFGKTSLSPAGPATPWTPNSQQGQQSLPQEFKAMYDGSTMHQQTPQGGFMMSPNSGQRPTEMELSPPRVELEGNQFPSIQQQTDAAVTSRSMSMSTNRNYPDTPRWNLVDGGDSVNRV
ncbi:hypothetical protein B0H66DRAFT_636505 [Apodospora peruviana]|uniref:Uncharacterized protein n=1 Tax=Apodospora peruviana TaxID=516989 RepID=A0AAE0IHF7_9PEZI|nr:hypothetical protein B0H66DRAFT_636505 [Apodospora peruviana]